jgi:hypothetical protein
MEPKHKHTIDCYATNATGVLAYTPCRNDGLDANLANLNPADFRSSVVSCNPGLTLLCTHLNVPSELDLCPTCLGQSNAYCATHGIGASNARQSEFYRRWNERHGE